MIDLGRRSRHKIDAAKAARPQRGRETVEKPLRWVFLDSLAPACGPVSPIFCEKSAVLTVSGNRYNPNIPSEEVFISPKKGEAEGTVYSVMPMSYRGELIENFSITFKDGKAVEVHAEKNEELLKELISMDEGAAMLGECALVPYDSPIRNSGILFYNTLFDENAACHLALGEGFPSTIDGGENLSIEQCREMGINKSIIHEDLMIGAKDLDITAKTRDGREIQIFKNGNWAF